MQKALGAISISILMGMLAAGLWPFNPSPPNQVTWLPRQNGLRFGEYGTIWTSSPFRLSDSQGESSVSLEVWLQPAVEQDENTLLAFCTSQDPLRFEFQQYRNGLLVRRNVADPQGHSRTFEIEIADIFRRNKQVFITVTAGQRMTTVYVDGRMVKRSPHFGLTRDDLAGQLVFGTSPVESAPWRGNLLGLALYDRELTETQVAQNYHRWIQSGRPGNSAKESPVALYLFEEHTGDLAHDSARYGRDFNIPRHFGILQKPVLVMPQRKDLVRWSYWADVFVNVVGFIPLGFFVCAYLSSRRTRRAALAAIMVGAMVSLTIEILQVYLPTRDSDMTDLVANTFGTIIGVLSYRRTIARLFLASLHRITYA